MSTQNAQYSYDDQGRLIGVTFPNGAMATYSYDTAGNRTTVVEVPATTPLTPLVEKLPKKYSGDFGNNPMMVKVSSGELVGWGDNATGTLSNGVGTATNEPPQKIVFDPTTTVPPMGTAIEDWAFTNANLYVVFANGWVYSAGMNNYGQLGRGITADTPVRPQLSRIESLVGVATIKKVWAAGSKQLTNGGGCVYFQASDYRMYGCGHNTAGNLGLGTVTNPTTPQLIGNMPTSPNYVKDVVVIGVNTSFAAYFHTTENKVLVAGYNLTGNLGINSIVNQNTFVNAQKVGGTAIDNIKCISATGGLYSTITAATALFVDSDGYAWTCGYNGQGQLGSGNTTTPRTRFDKVLTQTSPAVELSGVDKAEIGGGPISYAYATTSTGGFYTWGYNGGNGLFKNSSTPANQTLASTTVLPLLVTAGISKVFFPQPNALGVSSQLFVLTEDGMLRYSGTADNGMLPITDASTPGVKYLALPRQILDGTELVMDIFVHGTSTTQRLFILTNAGNVYACGNNTDGICTGGIVGTTPPASVAAFKLDLKNFG